MSDKESTITVQVEESKRRWVDDEQGRRNPVDYTEMRTVTIDTGGDRLFCPYCGARKMIDCGDNIGGPCCYNQTLYICLSCVEGAYIIDGNSPLCAAIVAAAKEAGL